MTQTALRNREIASKERMQDKQLAHEVRENRKDRTMKYITGFASAAGRAIPKFAANDPDWYKRYITDLDKFTNVATYFRLGTTKLPHYVNSVSNGISAMPSVPGIAVGNYYITSGHTMGATSIQETPINQILMRLKEQVLKSNSRSRVNYEAADLGLNIFATASIVNQICEAERALYVAQTYKGDNAYFAKYILKALGWDADAVLNNLPDFRKYIILTKTRFNSACVAPADLAYYKRLMYLSSTIYKDNDSATPTQLYAFRSLNYFDLAIEDDFELCESHATSSAQTPIAWYNQVSTQIQLITENADYVEMYADLRSAFGDNILQLSTNVDENATIELIYNPLVHEQISCARSLPCLCNHQSQGSAWYSTYAPTLVNQLHIYSNSNGYLQQTAVQVKLGIANTHTNSASAVLDPYYDFAHNGEVGSQTLNMHKDSITGDDILDVTRFNLVGDYTPSSDVFAVRDSGTEVLSHWNIAVINNAGSVYPFSLIPVGSINLLHGYTASDGGQAAIPGVYTPIFNLISAFDWMPIISFAALGAVNAKFTQCSIGDVSRAFSIDNETMRRINEACALSLFYVNTSAFKR